MKAFKSTHNTTNKANGHHKAKHQSKRNGLLRSIAGQPVQTTPSGKVFQPGSASKAPRPVSAPPKTSKLEKWITARGQLAPSARADSKSLASVPSVPAAGFGQQVRPHEWLDNARRLYRDWTGRDPDRDALAAGKKLGQFLMDWHHKQQTNSNVKVTSVTRPLKGASGGKKSAGWESHPMNPSGNHDVRTSSRISQSARQILMSAPAAYSMAPPQTGFSTMTGTGHTRDGITIEGCDYLSLVTPNNTAGTGSNQPAGSHLINMDLNPSVLNIPRVNQLAALFEQFHFDYFRIYYAPGCATDTPGSMCAFTETDPDDQLSPDLNTRVKQCFGHAQAKTSSFFTPARFDVICKQGKFYVDAGAEERLTTQAHFNCLVLSPDSTNAATGVFFVEYRLKLWRSRMDSNGAAGNWWGMEIKYTTSASATSLVGAGFVQRNGETYHQYSGASLVPTVSIVTSGSGYSQSMSLFTFENTVPTTYLVLVDSYSTSGSADRVPNPVIELRGGTAFDTVSDPAAYLASGSYIVGSNLSAAAASTAAYTVGEGSLTTAEGYKYNAASIENTSGFPQGRSRATHFLIPSQGVLTFGLHHLFVDHANGTYFSPNAAGQPIQVEILVVALNLPTLAPSLKRLRQKTSLLTAKMKALQDEVESAATQLEKMESDRQAEREQKADSGGSDTAAQGASAVASEVKDELRRPKIAGLGERSSDCKHEDLQDPQGPVGGLRKVAQECSSPTGRWKLIPENLADLGDQELSDVEERSVERPQRTGVPKSDRVDSGRSRAVERAIARTLALEAQESELRERQGRLQAERPQQRSSSVK